MGNNLRDKIVYESKLDGFIEDELTGLYREGPVSTTCFARNVPQCTKMWYNSQCWLQSGGFVPRRATAMSRIDL